MKIRKRLTRQESKEVTRARLIEAAERFFIRKGFDDTSVEEISEAAGYSRGAFYSNFEDKDQVFLEVVRRRRPRVLGALEDIFQQISEPAERMAVVREWFSNEFRLRDLVALQMEFSRRAMKNRSIRKDLGELFRYEVEVLAASVSRCLTATNRVPADRPEIIGVALLAVAHGLGTFALDTGPEWDDLYADAARLAFDRMMAPQISHNG